MATSETRTRLGRSTAAHQPSVPKVSARLAQAGCRKRGCIARCGHPARHHIRHQAMWIGCWGRRRSNEPRWQHFVTRYYCFRSEDVVTLGANHHAEIHILYDIIIDQHRTILRKHLSEYTWAEAEHLMDCFERAFNVWLSTPTPGFSTQLFNRLNLYRSTRGSRRKLLQQGVLPRLEANAARKYEARRAELYQQFLSVCTVQTVPSES